MISQQARGIELRNEPPIMNNNENNIDKNVIVGVVEDGERLSRPDEKKMKKKKSKKSKRNELEISGRQSISKKSKKKKHHKSSSRKLDIETSPTSSEEQHEQEESMIDFSDSFNSSSVAAGGFGNDLSTSKFITPSQSNDDDAADVDDADSSPSDNNNNSNSFQKPSTNPISADNKPLTNTSTSSDDAALNRSISSSPRGAEITVGGGTEKPIVKVHSLRKLKTMSSEPSLHPNRKSEMKRLMTKTNTNNNRLSDDEEEVDILGAAEIDYIPRTPSPPPRQTLRHDNDNATAASRATTKTSKIRHPTSAPGRIVREEDHTKSLQTDIHTSEHNSSATTEIRVNRADKKSPIREPKLSSLFDDFASFAEASLGGGGSLEDGTGGGSDVLSIQGSLITATTAFTTNNSNYNADDEVMPHDMLVAYLLSMGTPRPIAEEVAFGFMAQKNKNIRSQSDRNFRKSTREQQQQQRRVPRSIVTSKLNYLEQSSAAAVMMEEGRYHSNSDASVRSVAHSAPSVVNLGSINSNNNNNDDVASVRSQRPLPRPPRTYTRADVPGAVVMQGRAYGAPIRMPNESARDLLVTTTTSNTNGTATSGSSDEDEDGPPGLMVEATTVQFEQVVVADKLSGTKLLFAGPMRKLMAICLMLFLLIVVVVTCAVVFTRPEGTSLQYNEEEGGGEAIPTNAPTVIRDEILFAASRISGWDLTLDLTSPQYRAVGWLSTFDSAEFDDYDGEKFLQRYVMVTFYYSTGGEKYVERENWMNPLLNECDWSAGILCTNNLGEYRNILSIDLIRNGLSGVLPPEIGLLKRLERIRLSMNQLTGTIPSEISLLSSLKTLDLASNSITGTIPQAISNATQVDFMGVSHNELTGLIPIEVWDLTLLRTLDMSFNRLSGSIPYEVQKLDALVTLDLRENMISGSFPSAFRNMDVLQFLHLDNNKLTGSIPSIDRALTRRQEVTLSHNQLSGQLPRVNVSDVDFDPTSMRIQKVDLSYNLLTGQVAAIITPVPSLRYIDYSGNLLRGTFPNSPGFISLEFVAAANNFFTGSIPYMWPSTLASFDFSGNHFQGEIPTSLCGLSSLEILKLSDNQLDASIPACVSELDKLRVFEVSRAGLIGAIPTQVEQLQDLSILDVSRNALTGPIPIALGQLGSITRLHLNDNLFEGTIPTQIGSLRLLQQLYLAKNELTGEVPSVFGDTLPKLQNFTLYDNQGLVGNIPSTLCSIPTLHLSFQDVGCDLGCGCCSGAQLC